MNKHIEDLQQYIKTVSVPGSYSPFPGNCKNVYDGRCQNFKAMLDRLNTCEVDTMQLIINNVNPKINRGRLTVCFIFAIYARDRDKKGAIQNADIAKTLSLIDFGKCWCATVA